MTPWPPLDVGDTLVGFTIYDHPLDYPNEWVVRRWWIDREDNSVRMDVVPRLAQTLEEARALVPEGLYRLGRAPTDDPFIVETWI